MKGRRTSTENTSKRGTKQIEIEDLCSTETEDKSPERPEQKGL